MIFIFRSSSEDTQMETSSESAEDLNESRSKDDLQKIFDLI